VPLSGCISAKTYADPTYAKARYEDLQHPIQPLAVEVNAQFERNGQRKLALDNQVRGRVEPVLRATTN
jgi:hypothetical protein